MLHNLNLEEAASEDSLKENLQNLQKQLGKKQNFEQAVSSIKYILIHYYSSASPSLRKSIYSVVCRVATILQTRYTAPGFWLAGKGLFEEAEQLVTDSSERKHLRACIAKSRDHLHELENQPEASPFTDTRATYLFEGHLTVDPEPPRPQWMVARNLLDRIAASAESIQTNGANDDILNALIQELGTSMGDFPNMEEAIEASMQLVGAKRPRRPPASKDVVKKLPIVNVTEEVLMRLGSARECSVCKEDLTINDKLQELPCKHLYHPHCLKQWLDQHNSCPECRYELPTDDHAYEGQKERDKEDEEERKGAANALPGGEFMYV
ncbi:E3 ubiquitin-protein ligase aip2 [Thalictrum thalictroides]|uniref:RING-type E3 ubiquitin transferase n=1 Tax=Thalictrum thalictroides TaxID=46969 RepID=A0A7J6X8Q0_THATH|nr:E3 ubiquitin-protein ligase aip2 [Thalictrum thalictroides]